MPADDAPDLIPRVRENSRLLREHEDNFDTLHQKMKGVQQSMNKQETRLQLGRQSIENLLKEIRWIKQLLVVGVGSLLLALLGGIITIIANVL